MSYYCENCEERGETTEREVDRLREVVERDRARIAELERGEILADKELMSAIITAVMSSVQSDRNDALRKVQRHIIRVEKERDDIEAQCEHIEDYRALAESRIVELEAEVARLTAERDGPLYRCPQCDHLRLELGEARAEITRLTAERERGTAALRVAFGEELWRLGHPAYVVVHLREELEKITRLWKSAAVENDALLARVEAAERDAVLVLPWATFGHWCLTASREDFSDLDGGDLQDRAQECGLLEPIAATEPCGESCQCAELCDEWPAECLRMIDVPAAIAAMEGGK